ncbi:MAG: flagellar hook-associated protein 1 FlgK [Planctomycetota bacterium]|jgi:flagellar hook-associated protein 1 FlgK
MAAGIGLSSGLQALLASRVGLATVGHNITNANTPGYSRQSVDLAASRPVFSGGLLVGNGVNATSVRRTVDTLLQRRLLTQNSVQGRLESRFTTLSEIEALLQEPDGASLGGQLDGFFTSISSLSTNSSDSILRTGMINNAVQLTSQFNQMSGSLENIRQNTSREVAIRVNEVNDLAAEISSLNNEIAAAQSAGLAPNDLSDRRDLAVLQLSELVDIAAQTDATGATRVLVGGSTLVSSTRFHALTSKVDKEGNVELRIKGAAVETKPSGGILGGLVAVGADTIPDLQSKLDLLAKNVIREINRVHSAGVPASGSYSSLTGGSLFVDTDKDGDFRDELLSNAGLPTTVVNGELYVNITDKSTGEMTKSKIGISQSHTTVGEFLDSLSDIPHLSADIDGLGRIQLVADAGFGFDFGQRMDVNPDNIGGFGGGRASVGSDTNGPFALNDGDTLNLDVGGSTFNVTFNAADFANISEATAEEIAAVINADSNITSTGMQAAAVNGQLVLQTQGAGSTEGFEITGGNAATEFGWGGFAGNPISGQDIAVDVKISGTYTGSDNDVYTFEPTSNGTVGTTSGLSVDVLDSSGNRVATLDVGSSYVPGTDLQVAEGVMVSFGLGELSALHNDSMSVDVVSDSDTADALIAVGVGSFFTGTGASDIAVLQGIQTDPDLIASSVSGFDGDNQALLNLLDLENSRIDELGGASMSEFYGEIVGQSGFETASTIDALGANEALIQSLEQRQEQVSGVNVDEELVQLLEFEQSFQAASRFINVLNDLNDELLALL